MSSYFSINRRAVHAFFNPCKNEQFLTNYINTVISLRDHDQYSLKCFRSIFFILLFQSILQLYLYLFPFQWHHLVFFDIFDQSNNYPNFAKLFLSSLELMCAYLIYMIYFKISVEDFFELFYDYYRNGATAFVTTPVLSLTKFVVNALNLYQILMLVAGLLLFRIRLKANHLILI